MAAVAGEAQALGVKALAVRTDVTELAQVQTLAARAFETFGAVHVLCNNAGVAARGGLETAAHPRWQWGLGGKPRGGLHGVGAVLPRLIPGRAPRPLRHPPSIGRRHP